MGGNFACIESQEILSFRVSKRVPPPPPPPLLQAKRSEEESGKNQSGPELVMLAKGIGTDTMTNIFIDSGFVLNPLQIQVSCYYMFKSQAAFPMLEYECKCMFMSLSISRYI